MLVFLHIPRTGGTTFQFILANSFGFRHCHLGYTGRHIIEQEDIDFALKMFPWMKSMSGENIPAPLRLSVPNAYYITFLREPFARVLSHYQDDVLRGGHKLSLEDTFKTNSSFRNLQVKLLAGVEDLDKAKRALAGFSFVGMTEKFDLSLAALNRLCPVRLRLGYKRKLTARDNEVKRSLASDPRVVELIRRHNQLDLELYEFARQEIFPKHCNAAGMQDSTAVPSYERYSSQLQPRFLLHRLYNKGIFREVCKRVYRDAPPCTALPALAKH